MADSLVFSACFASLAVLAWLAARAFDRRLTLRFGLLFALYLGLDDLVTALGAQAGFALLGGDWNWSGKVYSLLLSALAIVVLRLRPEAVGLRMPDARSARHCW